MAVFGDLDNDGNLTITFNVHRDELAAPDYAIGDFPFGVPQKWYPCEMCGKLEPVGVNVVSFRCEGCERDLANEDREADRVFLGRGVLHEDGARGEGATRVNRERHDNQMFGEEGHELQRRFELCRERWLRAGLRAARIDDERQRNSEQRALTETVARELREAGL